MAMALDRDLVFNIRLDAEDRAILDAVAVSEKMARAAVIRRAVRHYAEHLGVKPIKPKKK